MNDKEAKIKKAGLDSIDMKLPEMPTTGKAKSIDRIWLINRIQKFFE